MSLTKIKIPCTQEIVHIPKFMHFIAMDANERWFAFKRQPSKDHENKKWKKPIRLDGMVEYEEDDEVFTWNYIAHIPQLSNILDWQESLFKIEDVLCD